MSAVCVDVPPLMLMPPPLNETVLPVFPAGNEPFALFPVTVLLTIMSVPASLEIPPPYPVMSVTPRFDPKVTNTVFRGYELFDSYCFRCHGADAVGGEYAPNLRASLNNGMTENEFLSIAMTGRKAQGMPAWAGFFSPQDIEAIYQYTKARAVGAVGTGTPQQ